VAHFNCLRLNRYVKDISSSAEIFGIQRKRLALKSTPGGVRCGYMLMTIKARYPLARVMVLTNNLENQPETTISLGSAIPRPVILSQNKDVPSSSIVAISDFWVYWVLCG